MLRWFSALLLMLALAGCATQDESGVVVEKPWHIFGTYESAD